MISQSAFRDALIRELAALASSRELDARMVQMGYVEEKHDVAGEFLDYYTDDLLKYEPFAREFTPVEIEELRALIPYLRAAGVGDLTWADVRSRAANLLRRLQP